MEGMFDDPFTGKGGRECCAYIYRNKFHTFLYCLFFLLKFNHVLLRFVITCPLEIDDVSVGLGPSDKKRQSRLSYNFLLFPPGLYIPLLQCEQFPYYLHPAKHQLCVNRVSSLPRWATCSDAYQSTVRMAKSWAMEGMVVGGERVEQNGRCLQKGELYDLEEIWGGCDTFHRTEWETLKL